MGIKLPFGFPLDYPEIGGRYEQLAHAENALFTKNPPSPNSAEWASYRVRMAKLNALETWAINIGNIRRRRNFVLLLAIFFGRQLRSRKPWEDATDADAFRDLETAANWRDPAPERFDQAGFRKAAEEADNIRTTQLNWDRELQANQNTIDTMLQNIANVMRGKRWLARLS